MSIQPSLNECPDIVSHLLPGDEVVLIHVGMFPASTLHSPVDKKGFQAYLYQAKFSSLIEDASLIRDEAPMTEIVKKR